jgi:hypothetical protein
MSFLSMAVNLEEGSAFRQVFQKASKDEDGGCCKFLCPTTVGVIAKAVGCKLIQLHSTANTV